MGGLLGLYPGGGPGGADVATFGTGGDYDDMEALIAAGLSDTYARNLDTGRYYLTDSGGYPYGTEVPFMGTATELFNVVGTEANAAAAGVAETTTGSGSVTWQAGAASDYVEIETTASADTAFLTLASGAGVADLLYVTGLVWVPTRAADAADGYEIANLTLSDNRAKQFYLSTDNGPQINFSGSSPATNGAFEVPAPNNPTGSFRWFEALSNVTFTSGPSLLWMDGKIIQCVGTAQSGALGEILLGCRGSGGGGAGVARFKHLRGTRYS